MLHGPKVTQDIAQVNDVTHHDNALFIFLLGKISDVVKTKLFYDSALISMWDK